MDFLKVKKLRKARRQNLEQESEDKAVPQPEKLKNENGGDESKSSKANPASEMEEDEDDDEFFTNEVKKRLKELRRNSFMVLIPEESCPEDEDDEEEGETSSSEWRDIEADGRQPWCGFDGVYDKYCERMLFFDKMSAQQLKEAGSQTSTPTPSPRSTSKKLTSPFRCLSLKKIEEPEEEMEHLQQSENDHRDDLETAYVAQLCLTWEALNCQYTQLSQKVACHPENAACYNHSAQQFQQFQVLLQRFIENEPFELGIRAEIYARTRNSLPKLLQVPIVQGSDHNEAEEEESDMLVHAPDLVRIIESSILTFHLFVKADKNKSRSVVLNLFGGQNQIATPLQLIQSFLEKKKMKLKELCKKRKGGKKKSWPAMSEEVDLLFGLIDIKVLSRVLRMERISKEQLLWCEEKINNLDLTEGKLKRDPSPVLFPC
ncbi:uncharacterized protein LOC131158065 [Malania oleifera]|uniref:uncharacterized protein LOC131158065 n=1 Tax=Malania oleifera TaxID=397392 RepID=UPI0025AE67B9|nr:uncharacterized protein LOC131158065 [Malania oleifera]